MRATTDRRVVAADPGSSATVVVEVVNTGAVIDGVSANVIGLPDEFVKASPTMLPLFPAASGQLTLSLAVPPSYPAGRHPLTVELVSHGANEAPHYLDVDLSVAPRPSMTMAPMPRVVRARRSGRFVLEVRNDGNLPVNVSLEAVDVDRAIKATFTPQHLLVEPGALVPVLLHVRGPRMLTGAEAERPVKIVATATRADLPADADPAAVGDPIAPREATISLKQRPLLSRGVLTALVLLTIVALWAGVFLLGLTKVFSGDPMTKAAPASFFAASQTGAKGGGSGAQAAAGGSGGGAAAAAPAGALPKTGQLPAGIGGQVTGTVISASTEQPVGQILVEAYRAAGSSKAVSSAATQADGTFTLGGLFPTDYLIKFSAPGFKPVWYPNATGKSGARAVPVQAQGISSGINTVVQGMPASISGKVDPGDTLHTVQTTVTARPLNVAGGNAMSHTVTTSAGGKYQFTGLAAPANYQLTFITPGYQTSTLIDSVNGGDKRLEASVTLGAAQGSISGLVRSGPTPIGGATVTTTVGGKTISVLTPTTGAVGTFAIPNLPTPATYVLNYSAPGHGSWTEVVELAAGQSYTKALGKLANGSGAISGLVRDGNSKSGLGGVTVTVGGALASAPAGTTATTATPSTTTLTNGNVGGFYLNGLADGQYTLTFTKDGYSSATVPVTLDSNRPANKPAPTVNVRLYKQDGEITGVVYTASGTPLQGATLSATDGTLTYTATSSAAGGALPPGGYDLAALPPGTYSVTASQPGARQQTRIVTVGRGRQVQGQDFYLAGG